MEEQKRKIFDETEAESFMICFDKFKNILENKKTDGSTNRDKQTAWVMLTEMFNSLPGVKKRDTKQLMIYYKNIKRKANKSMSERRMKIFKTGGGPAEKEGSNPVEERLLAMGIVREPLKNIYDSDASYHKMTTSGTSHFDMYNQKDLDDFQDNNSEIPQQSKETNEDTNVSDHLLESASETQNFIDQPTPTTKTYKLKRTRKSTPNLPITNKTADLLIQQCEFKKSLLSEEHEWKREKIQQDKIKHDLEIKLLNEQLKLYQSLNDKLAKGEEIHICVNTNK